MQENKKLDKRFNDHAESWKRFSKSVISIVIFLSEFNNYEQFNDFVSIYTNYRGKNEDYVLNSLPVYIASNLYNMGYTLVCDALKECGYDSFIKPDIHLINFYKIVNRKDKANEQEVQKFFFNLASQNEMSPYKLDKIIWLIGTEFFYHEMNKKPNIKNGIKNFLSNYGI